MSFVNPGKYTHEGHGYAVVRELDAKTCHYTGKYKVVDNDTYGAPWETPPVFKNKHKQVCIELCNYMNANGGCKAEWPDKFETEHFIFEGKQVGCSIYYEIHYKGFFVHGGVPILSILVEIIHRKNRRIKELKRDFDTMTFKYLKTKRLLVDLYKKQNEKSDNQIMTEITQNLYGTQSVPTQVVEEVLAYQKECKKNNYYI